MTGWIDDSLESADDDDHAVIVALVEGQLVGAGTLSESRHFTSDLDAYIGELVTAEGYEGQGVGRALLGAAEEWARAFDLHVAPVHSAVGVPASRPGSECPSDNLMTALRTTWSVRKRKLARDALSDRPSASGAASAYAELPSSCSAVRRIQEDSERSSASARWRI